jgi:ditrans,polycis-polyprenyl diphosphate synthase
MELGITYISVYAFSIDNYRRSTEEVDALMKMSAALFERLLHVSAVAFISGARRSSSSNSNLLLQS